MNSATSICPCCSSQEIIPGGSGSSEGGDEGGIVEKTGVLYLRAWAQGVFDKRLSV